MKKTQAKWLSLFLLVVFACNLPQSAGTNPTSESGIEGVTATPQVNEEEFPPYSMSMGYT